MRNLNKNLGVTLLVGALLFTSAILQAKKPSLQKTPVGIPITIKALFDEINANNPNKNSDFLIFIATNDPENPYAGKSANLKAWITDTTNPKNGQTLVQLVPDPAQIAFLQANGHLDAPTATFYAKYLLYFSLNGNKFYINNPWPGKLILNRDKKTMAKKPYTRNPTRDIMAKWQEWELKDKAIFDAAVAQAYPAPVVTPVTTPAKTTKTKSTKTK